MHAVEKRLLELVGILLKRQLTTVERDDLRFCHRFLVEREWKKGLLEMQSFMAYQTNDSEWQHEICRQIDALDGR